VPLAKSEGVVKDPRVLIGASTDTFCQVGVEDQDSGNFTLTHILVEGCSTNHRLECDLLFTCRLAKRKTFCCPGISCRAYPFDRFVLLSGVKLCRVIRLQCMAEEVQCHIKPALPFPGFAE
jgi:hypothetical protein